MHGHGDEHKPKSGRSVMCCSHSALMTPHNRAGIHRPLRMASYTPVEKLNVRRLLLERDAVHEEHLAKAVGGCDTICCHQVLPAWMVLQQGRGRSASQAHMPAGTQDGHHHRFHGWRHLRLHDTEVKSARVRHLGTSQAARCMTEQCAAPLACQQGNPP